MKQAREQESVTNPLGEIKQSIKTIPEEAQTLGFLEKESK